eukprot:TRINITY_DN27405_c0_g1_i1.p2 TRINITY_DN27405_c0_g1~~TRINITY_DN27405_c0_g1_i1.p2  ORF type:complete len:131 (-),score=5.92 TRINITY_DN27405_c0_g1_i1:116-508(-)
MKKKISSCTAQVAYAVKKQVHTCCTKGLKMFFIWRVALSITHDRQKKLLLKVSLSARILSSIIVWAKGLQMMSLRNATNAENLPIRIPTVKTMVVTYCLFNANPVLLNTMVAAALPVKTPFICLLNVRKN